MSRDPPSFFRKKRPDSNLLFFDRRFKPTFLPCSFPVYTWPQARSIYLPSPPLGHKLQQHHTTRRTNAAHNTSSQEKRTRRRVPRAQTRAAQLVSPASEKRDGFSERSPGAGELREDGQPAMASSRGEGVPVVPEEPVLGAAAAGGAAHVPRPRRPVRAPARQEALGLERQRQRLRTERQQTGPRRLRERRGGKRQGRAEASGIVIVHADQLVLLAGHRRLPRVHQAEFRARRGLWRRRQRQEISEDFLEEGYGRPEHKILLLMFVQNVMYCVTCHKWSLLNKDVKFVGVRTVCGIQDAFVEFSTIDIFDMWTYWCICWETM
jgi:hypothetical protein